MSERINTSFGPESSGPIQVFPPGLLGFLQLKNSGQNPHSLNLEMRPSLDIRDWLFEARQEVITITVSLAAAGTVGFMGDPALITVPTDEYWFVIDASCTGLIVTGERLAIAVAWRSSNTAPASAQIIMPDGGQRADVAYAGANAYDVVATAGHFFMPSGAQAGVYQSCADHAGALNSNLRLRIVRLPN